MMCLDCVSGVCCGRGGGGGCVMVGAGVGVGGVSNGIVLEVRTAMAIACPWTDRVVWSNLITSSSFVLSCLRSSMYC